MTPEEPFEVDEAEGLLRDAGYAPLGMFMRRHKILCRLVCVSPRGEGPSPSQRPPACSILQANFGE